MRFSAEAAHGDNASNSGQERLTEYPRRFSLPRPKKNVVCCFGGSPDSAQTAMLVSLAAVNPATSGTCKSPCFPKVLGSKQASKLLKSVSIQLCILIEMATTHGKLSDREP